MAELGRGKWWVIPGYISWFICFLAKKFLFFYNDLQTKDLSYFLDIVSIGFRLMQCSVINSSKG